MHWMLSLRAGAEGTAYPGLTLSCGTSREDQGRCEPPGYEAAPPVILVPLQDIYVQEEESRLQQHSRAKRSLA